VQISWKTCSQWALLTLSFSLLAFWAAAPGAQAVPEHSFDAALSLEGGCKGEDGIPDPGCPAGSLPPKAFDDACGTAVDRHGDVYVSSAAIGGSGTGTGGRIDIYDSQGEFLAEIKDEHQPCDLAVDSQGNLYVTDYLSKDVMLFEPGSYPPGAGEEYTATIVFDKAAAEPSCKSAWGVAVNPANDHLYAALTCMVVEYASAAEGSGTIREGIGSFLPSNALRAIDVYGLNGDLYLTSATPGSISSEPENARFYVLAGSSEAIECEAGGFSFGFGRSGVAVDQANGDAYVDDVTGNHVIKQFDSGCAPIGTLPAPPVLVEPNPFASIAVDDPCLVGEEDCNPAAPYMSPNEGYVFIGSGSQANKSHLYAYAPRIVEAPEIEAQVVSGVSEGEARLEAKINPHGLETTYHFEYVTQKEFEETGYANAVLTTEESAGAAGSFVTVSAAVSGLQPDTGYRFRAVASNCEAQGTESECLTLGEGNLGAEGLDASFATYPTPPHLQCSNEGVRKGPSAELPDCRAYELVTPAQTNGRIPTMAEMGRTNSNGFDTDLASPDGESLTYGVDGGSLPGSEGNGFHDTYVATRGQSGWHSEFSGLRGKEASEVYPGGVSPDNRYSFWLGEGGSLAPGNYLRGPGGVVEPIGLGSMGTDLEAYGHLISTDGTHVIFSSNERLEEAAPLPGGAPIEKIYDREADGSTQVVSLLPGNLTPAPLAQVAFQGATVDGEAVAFKIDGTLYLRRGGITQEVANGQTYFGGIAAHGARVTYLRPSSPPVGIDPPRGNIFSYDSASGETTNVGSGGESILVHVSADGSHVFFVSPLQLVGSEGTPGAHNLYVWDTESEAVEFIATVTERDVFGEAAPDVTQTMTDGLGLWINHTVDPNKHPTDGPGSDPSRSTADGKVFIFESRAQLTAYPNEGHAEIYRYAEGKLGCISCDPTGSPAQTDARLQGPNALLLHSLPPVNSLVRIANLTADGRAAFFQSAEPLIAADNDGKIDVYEWQAEGNGGCEREMGCLALISSRQSDANEYLYSMTPNGQDVFIETAEPLVADDPDGGHSVYDARVDGGFAPSPLPPVPCQGADACRTLSSAPASPNVTSGPFAGQNVNGGRHRCARNKKGHRGRHCAKHKHRRAKKPSHRAQQAKS
jgi:hypothetical protein